MDTIIPHMLEYKFLSSVEDIFLILIKPKDKKAIFGYY